ncbi:UbiA family prenyltransferase [Streptomyces sp. M10(2022)]
MSGAPAADAGRPVKFPERVVRSSPAPIREYLLLMRLHAPTGIVLYLLPGLWSMVLAAEGMPDPSAIVCLALAAVLVRGASIAVNDVVDKDIDARVARTKSRPVVAGTIGSGQALAFGAVLAVASLLVLSLVNVETALVVAVSYPLLVAYPYMKRVFFWPSAWLAPSIASTRRPAGRR